MTTTRAIQLSDRVASFGSCTNYSFYDSTPDNAATSTARLTSLTIGLQPGLQSIELTWSNGARTKHGSGGQTSSTFDLNENEHITTVMIFFSYTPGSQLYGFSIETNFGREAKFGLDKGGCSTFGVFEKDKSDMALRMGLLAFHCYLSDSGIFGLAPVWAEYLPVVTTVKYERILSQPGHTVRIAPGPVADSAFTRLLMSPMVALCVGPAGKTFFVPETTLRELPFFRAAFSGLFAEGGLRALTLLEDDPAAVSALLEFLTTGVYTYTFHADATSTLVPAAGHEEGGFHSAVYVVAEKYECAPLVATAMQNLRKVMKEVSGLEVIRVWIAAYESGVRVLETGVVGDGYIDRLDAKVLRTVKKMLYEDEGEIDRALREVPDFGKDLLKITVREVCKD